MPHLIDLICNTQFSRTFNRQSELIHRMNHAHNNTVRLVTERAVGLKAVMLEPKSTMEGCYHTLIESVVI